MLNAFTAKISSKGQIAIPSSLRSEMNIQSGDIAKFIKLPNGHYEFAVISQEIKALKGIIDTDKTVSIDEMNDVIAAKAGQQ